MRGSPSNSSGSNPSGGATKAPKGYRVALTERASIVARGEQVELWFVRLQDAWVRAVEHPGARVEQESVSHEASESASERCPSGTIWIRTTELMLPAGTRLLQRQSAPRPRELSVMNYLKQGLSTTQRVVRERHFVVTGNYRLMPVGRMLVSNVLVNNVLVNPVSGSDASSEADDTEALSEIA